MSGILWRIIIAVICVVLVFALVPLIFQVIGFPLSGALWSILRICIAGIALLYIITGTRWFSPPA